MESGDTARIIGQLESMTKTTAESLQRVLQGQDDMRRDVAEMARRVDAKFDHHSESDEKNFAAIREGIGGLRDRIAQLEPIVDTVESHGEAILEIEKRMGVRDADLDKRLAVRDAATQQDQKWRQGIVGLAGATIGTTGALGGPKLWKWLASLFGH